MNTAATPKPHEITEQATRLTVALERYAALLETAKREAQRATRPAA